MGDKTGKHFSRKSRGYQWIIRSIEQRKETIMKSSTKIVEKQPDYFIKGPNHLRPMTMKEVSDELGIHESTVSRAVREKYAQTPFGTVELKIILYENIFEPLQMKIRLLLQVKNVISS